ncbi:hypothetical protein MK280_12385 [Myxococcota bacterium]|nr:hypothetical protein [Myxococcota bacterium]
MKRGSRHRRFVPRLGEHHAFSEPSGECPNRRRLRLGLALPLVLGLAFSAEALDQGADGEFEKRTSSHFILYQDVDIDETSGLRGSRRFEQDVLNVLEAAYRSADQKLGLRPDGPLTVIVYDPEVFDQTFAGQFRFPVAGFYGGRVHIRGDTVVTDRLAAVLHHEYVHAAFDEENGRHVLPAWLNEGVAEWFEARSLGLRSVPSHQRRRLRVAAARGRLYELDALSFPSFGHLGPEGASLAYLQSWSFIDELVRRRGERGLREWLRDIVRRGDIDRATRRVYRDRIDALYEDHLAALAAGR